MSDPLTLSGMVPIMLKLLLCLAKAEVNTPQMSKVSPH
jgi:hypothetical protein